MCLSLFAIFVCANAGLLDLLGQKLGKGGGGGGGGNSGPSVIKVSIFSDSMFNVHHCFCVTKF